MSKTLTGFICAALGSIVVTVLAIGWTVVMLGHHATFSLAKADVNSDKLGVILDDADRQRGHGKPQGVVQNLNDLIIGATFTDTLINKAALHYDTQLTRFDGMATQLFTDLHSTATAAQTTLNASTGTLNAMTGTLGEAQGAIKHVGPVLDSANTVIGQFSNTTAAITPRLESLLDQAGPVMTNVRGMTNSGNRILKDGADEADKLVHPPVKKVTFWGVIDGTVLWVHSHLVPPIF